MVLAPSKAQEATHDAKEDGLKHDELLHPSIHLLWTKHHQMDILIKNLPRTW